MSGFKMCQKHNFNLIDRCKKQISYSGSQYVSERSQTQEKLTFLGTKKLCFLSESHMGDF